MQPGGRLQFSRWFLVVSALFLLPSNILSGQTKDVPIQEEATANRLQGIFKRAVEEMQQNHWREARADFESLLKAKPESAELHDFLGYVMLQQAEYQQAMSEFRKALKIKPDFQQARTHLAEALQAHGESQMAIQEFQRALEMGPLDVAARIAYAHALSASGSNDKAEEQLKAVIAAVPG